MGYRNPPHLSTLVVMVRNTNKRRGGQRVGKTLLSADAKRRRLIRRAIIAWIVIIFAVAVIRACAMRMARKPVATLQKG